MHTDKLFQEFFQIAPHTIFELLGMTPACPYRYESPVVKASERRMDGFLEPTIKGSPYYFVEFQGYFDPLIYWRGLHHVTRQHEIRSDLDGKNWKLIVFFLDASHDPGIETIGPLAKESDDWLIHKVLPDILTQMSEASPLLNVLKPLIVTDIEQVREQGAAWATSLKTYPGLSKRQRGNLIDLLIKFLSQRFVRLSYKELEIMLQLTPIEETRAGKELIAIGEKRGEKKGENKGLLKAIRIALNVRFVTMPTEQLQRILRFVKQINDQKSAEMLLAFSLQVDSPDLFEQKVLELTTAPTKS